MDETSSYNFILHFLIQITVRLYIFSCSLFLSFVQTKPLLQLSIGDDGKLSFKQ